VVPGRDFQVTATDYRQNFGAEPPLRVAQAPARATVSGPNGHMAEEGGLINPARLRAAVEGIAPETSASPAPPAAELTQNDIAPPPVPRHGGQEVAQNAR
jgi:hypothetical protein